jgi:hypothetical protein
MTRLLAAAVLTLHGLVHLIGFVVPWRIAQLEGFPYRTTAFNGSLVLGEDGVRVLGIAWLLLAVGFVVAAMGVWRGERWALPVTAVLAVVSAVVCVLGLPEAVAGVVVDVAILAVVAYVAFLRPRATGAPR